ncbi:MAG: DUF885 family protein, partial [Gammaproteobacteria bacterium]
QAAEVGPELVRRGLIFVGLDVIGGQLTEINVTSPTCIRELDAQYGIDIAGQLMEAIEASHAADREAMDRLVAIDPAYLATQGRLSREMYRKELQSRLNHYRYQRYLIPLNQRGGPHTAYETAERLRFNTARDYEDWIARMEAFGPYVDQTIALLKKGLRSDVMHPHVIAERIADQISAQAATPAADSPWLSPFREMPESLPPEVADDLRARGLAAVETVIRPAYARFDQFFRGTYLAQSRDTVGVWDQPEGLAYYEARARHFTTTDLTPAEIHDIGLSEVARIRAEMEAIREQVGFEGDLEAFFQHLRTDPQFYFDTPEALFEAYLATSKRVDPALVKLFGKMPRMPYGVRPIPEAIAPDTTTAYYSRPAADGSRAGYYYVNLYRPEVRPKYEIEALTIHEAVPGHHFQIALAMEIDGLPAFRRYGGVTAFVEGWALYAESLGPELGMYTDPYSKFGQLTYEMWRAVRLVVDTGIHAMKWDRQRAIDYFRANAAKTEADIVNEIDRYIAWPGQALAYKIGELKIKELRARATAALGENFDIRAFHDLVLSNGAIPLDSLEQLVDEWIVARQTEAGA